MRLAINHVSIFVYLLNRVQEEEYLKLVTNLDASQVEITSTKSKDGISHYPKMVSVNLNTLVCSEVIEFLQRLEVLPS